MATKPWIKPFGKKWRNFKTRGGVLGTLAAGHKKMTFDESHMERNLEILNEEPLQEDWK